MDVKKEDEKVIKSEDVPDCLEDNLENVKANSNFPVHSIWDLGINPDNLKK